MEDELVQINIADLNLTPNVEIVDISQVATDLGLTKEEAIEFDAFQTTNKILGPAAGSVLVCPGNQEHTQPDNRCPYYYKCPLRRMGKAPQDKLCPLEKAIVEDRFSAWCREIDQDPSRLTESDRSFVADLTWIDLQVQRCVHILAVGEDARLMHKNVTEAILMQENQPPVPITYEKVLHVTTQRLDQLLVQRRILLREWMLTPEQKFKIAKETGQLNRNSDISTEQSIRADKLRKAMNPIDL